jgi:peptidoglycan/LPS O-acetylase OafA/YrhL
VTHVGSRDRILAAVWLLAALPVGLLGYLAFAISEDAAERWVGFVLVALAGLAVLIGGLLWGRPRPSVVRGSLLVSFVWLGGAAFAALTMDFAGDRLLLGGLPAAVATVTATLASRRLRGSRGRATNRR